MLDWLLQIGGGFFANLLPLLGVRIEERVHPADFSEIVDARAYLVNDLGARILVLAEPVLLHVFVRES